MVYGLHTYIYIWNIYFTFIQTPPSSDEFALKLCVTHVFSSLKLHPGGLNYSLALQRHAGQPPVLQALTLGFMRSNDYKNICRQFFIVDVVDKVD